MTTDTIEAPAEATPSAASATPADSAPPQTLPQGDQDQTPQEQQRPEGEQTTDDPEAKARRVQDATQRRINRLVAERAQERAQRQLLEQRLAALEPAADDTQQRAQPVRPDPAAVQREARALVEAQEFVRQCNAVVAKGKAAFPDFEASLATLSTVTGPLLDESGRPEPLLSAVLDGADEPHRVLKHLAANPDIAADLLDLSPRKQAARIALMERDLKAPARLPSQAPAPLTPLAPSGGGDGEPDPSDTSRWNDWFDKRRPTGRRR